MTTVMRDFGNEKVICILVVGEEAVFIIPTGEKEEEGFLIIGVLYRYV
jgi:hypothetical protein